MFATKLSEGNDFSELMELLVKHSDLFDRDTFRTTYLPDSPHREVHDIILRHPDVSIEVQDELLCHNWPAMDVFTKALYPHISALMAHVGAISVGRVIITALEKDKQIYPHIDEGKAADHFHRFHLVLHGEDATLHVGEEVYTQNTGEVWWLNNKMMHSVINYGEAPRTIVVVDLELLDLAGDSE